MLPSFTRDVVTLVEPTWVEERGNKVATYPGPGVEVGGCSVQPGAATEDMARRDNVVVRATVFLPPGVAVTRHAKVIFEGDEFQIDGIPMRWRSALGGADHTVLALVDWQG